LVVGVTIGCDISCVVAGVVDSSTVLVTSIENGTRVVEPVTMLGVESVTLANLAVADRLMVPVAVRVT
jgi:hypothetical protein